MDITGSKRAEESIRRAYEEMKKRIEEQTSELSKANRELREEIAKRKRVEAALLESEERYRNLINISPDVISSVSLETGTITSLNQAFEKYTGFSREQWIGRSFTSIIHPDDVPLAEERYQRFLNGEDLSPFILRVLNRPGKELIGEFMIVPGVENGKMTSYFGFVRDVTARKQAEEEVRRQALRKELILRTAMDAFCITDSEGNILEINDAATQIYGYSREEAIGKNIVDFDIRTPRAIKDHMNEVIKKGSDRFETKLQCKDGRILDVEVSTNFVEMEEGFIFSFIRDITDKKRADQMLKQREKELEIKSSALEETNSALRILLARRDADKAELEEKVLSNVKELVAPYLERMRRGKLDYNQKVYLNIIESNLNDIISAFMPGLPIKYLSLTPTEIQIADLVKQGRSSKDIAKLFNLSRRTIESHRDNIRGKLGIKKMKVNLRSYLLSLE
jgi:PAS domain S-box-containing protein